MGRNILVIAAVIVLAVTGFAFANKMGMGGSCSLHHAQ